MRKLKEIVADYKKILTVKDTILRIMDDKNYEFSTKVKYTEKYCQDFCTEISDIKKDVTEHLLDLTETNKGSSLLRFNFKKWEKEYNHWLNSNPSTIAGVFEDACTAQNLLKFEIALNSLFATDCDVKLANAIASKGFAQIGSDTQILDSRIFNSALMVAQVDEGKTAQTKPESKGK